MIDQDNLPLGSDRDSRAPWNSSKRLCRYCHHDEIKEELLSNYSNEEQEDETITEQIEEEILTYPLCLACYKEEFWEGTDDDY